MMCNVYFFEINENFFFFDFIGIILLRCVCVRLYFVDLRFFVEFYWYYKIIRLYVKG